MTTTPLTADEKAARRSDAARKAARTRKRNEDRAREQAQTVTVWIHEAGELRDTLARRGVRVAAPSGQVEPANVPSVGFYACQTRGRTQTAAHFTPGEPGLIVGTLRYGLHACTITPREGLHPESLAALLGFVKQWLDEGRTVGDWAGWDHGTDPTLSECYSLDIVRPFTPHDIGKYLDTAMNGLFLQLDDDPLVAALDELPTATE